MRKRKILGILKYGTRGYPKSAQKFQEGGFVAVSKAYDWRDDPYELMLLDQKAKAASDKLRSRGRSKAKSANIPDLPTFDRLDGGIQVTNEAINNEFGKLQAEYYNNVKTKGVEWVASYPGQLAFNRIEKEGDRLESRAKAEEEDLKSAFENIKPEDRKTLAISANDNIMVRDAATNQGLRLSMDQYLSNVDKYRPMKLDEFKTWKEREDTALQTNLTDEFLKGGAVGHNTLRKTFIDGKDDQIQFSFAQGAVKRKAITGDAPDGYLLDLGTFKQGINNLMLGSGFQMADPVEKQKQKDITTEVVKSVYSDIMGESSNASVLDASLAAEILADNFHRAKILEQKTPEDKHNYLEEQKKLLLVSKVIDKNYKKSAPGDDGSTVSAGATTHKSTGSRLFADLEGLTKSGNITQYTIGVGLTSATDRKVQDVNMPANKNGIDQSTLGLVWSKDKDDDLKRQANRFNRNKEIAVYTDITDIYLPSGDNLKTLLGGTDAVDQFIGEDAVIAPNGTMPLVLMPMDGKKRLRTKDILELGDVKLKARDVFKKSVRGKLRDASGNLISITTPSDDLLPGNLDPKAASDAKEYLAWIQKGYEFNKYREAYRRNKTPENLANFEMAKDAQDVIQSTTAVFDRKFKGSPVEMQPMLGTTIVFDDDRVELKEKIEGKLGKGFGSQLVKRATDEERRFLQEVNDIDNRNFWSDNVYKTTIFTRIKNLGTAAAEAGEKLPGVAVFNEINEKLINQISGMSAVSNPDARNIVLFLMQ